jgi:D-glycero-D-manno-heptose 1,7-bisphosphate phosphatase
VTLVLLDRDGVVNRDSPHYIRQPEDWEPIPGSLEAIARLNRRGWQVAICTNQAGISRGLLTPEDLDAIHARLHRELAALGGTLADIFVCPHADPDGCTCRKPSPGLLQQACNALGYTPSEVTFIGDSARDLEAARRAGSRPLLVLTGNGQRTLAEGAAEGCDVFQDLAAAAAGLLETGRER